MGSASQGSRGKSCNQLLIREIFCIDYAFVDKRSDIFRFFSSVKNSAVTKKYMYRTGASYQCTFCWVLIYNFDLIIFLCIYTCPCHNSNAKMPCAPAIASMSLGRAWVHSLPEKLSQAAKAGFKGVEIFYEDLEYLAKEKGPVNDSTLFAAAQEARAICDHYGLEVIGMQPFLFYEGLTDRAQHREKIERLKLWFAIVKILGTDIIQIPSNFQSEGISGDLDLIVSDMIEVADMGLKEEPVVRFAYENLAWGTFISTWEDLWEVVRRVDRPNFGCCLDTFNIAGRVWADPASASGKTPGADAALAASLQSLVRTVDVNKVFYVQVVDAERMQQPLIEGHPFYVEGQPARMSWSRNARLFLYEQERGGYLPVVQVAEAFLKRLGFEGWVSMELFSRSMADPDPTVPETHAQRGINAWRKLAEELDL